MGEKVRLIASEWMNTYCHNCGELLIERYGFGVLKYGVTEGKRCPKCDAEIPISGQYVRSVSALEERTIHLL